MLPKLAYILKPRGNKLISTYSGMKFQDIVIGYAPSQWHRNCTIKKEVVKRLKAMKYEFTLNSNFHHRFFTSVTTERHLAVSRYNVSIQQVCRLDNRSSCFTRKITTSIIVLIFRCFFIDGWTQSKKNYSMPIPRHVLAWTAAVWSFRGYTDGQASQPARRSMAMIFG